MSRRPPNEDSALSLDAFLDIATNVVGILILVAVVTVLGAGDIAISSGATSLRAPSATGSRLLFECKNGEIYFVDELGNAERIREAVIERHGSTNVMPEDVVALLTEIDVGTGPIGCAPR